jgi:hypothetical protein
MDSNERNIRLARLIESEHGKVLIEVIDIWIAGILDNLDIAGIEELPKVVGAYINMKQFKNHIIKSPDVVNAINLINQQSATANTSD